MDSARQGRSFITDSRTPQQPDSAPHTPKRQRKQLRSPQQGHSGLSYGGTLVSFSKPSRSVRADTSVAPGVTSANSSVHIRTPCGLSPPPPRAGDAACRAADGKGVELRLSLLAGHTPGSGCHRGCQSRELGALLARDVVRGIQVHAQRAVVHPRESERR